MLYTLGPGEKSTATSEKFKFVSPTDVAVAANGDIYIVDGYGSFLSIGSTRISSSSRRWAAGDKSTASSTSRTAFGSTP